MKLLVVKTAYHEYVKKFYLDNPLARHLCFAEQTELLQTEKFWGGGGNPWRDPLFSLGCRVDELLVNVGPLQRAWAREHRLKPRSRQRVGSTPAWISQIAAAQIRMREPDILFIQDHSMFTRGWLEMVRREVPSLKKIVAWCGAPPGNFDALRPYDLILSCIPELVDRLREHGLCSAHLHHAFDRRVLADLELDSPRSLDVVFTGRVIREPEYHESRAVLLDSLAKKLPLRIFSSARRRRLVYRYEPPVYGLAMYQTLQRAKVVLNTHIDVSPRSASNARLFEATGVGTCVLTEWRENLSSLFDPEVEIVTYRSADECAEKARWLLSDARARERIATAGQRKTLRAHTYDNRAPELLGMLGSPGS